MGLLPAPLAYGVALLRGDLRHQLDRSRREDILCSLEGVLGNQLSHKERGKVARDCFRLRSCEAMDRMRLRGEGQALARLVEIRGAEYIEAALAAGKGALLCSAHFGSHHACFSLLSARGFPITVISLSPSFRRGHLRLPLIQPRPGRFGVAFQAAFVLRQNELVGTHLDPVVRPTDRERAVNVDFLNRQALLLPGAITIAQLTAAPVLMTFLTRSADWRHQVLEISPPIPVEGDTIAAFQRCLASVELKIRRDPAHWHYWISSSLVKLGLLEKGGSRSISPAGQENSPNLKGEDQSGP